jgi:NADH:ubiquinone reductase (H+-translocating)
MKHIVIAGGGFGGINCALEFNRRLGGAAPVQITLVNRHSYHLMHANLYEVATSPEELTSLAQLKRSVTIPIPEIVAGSKIKFQQAGIKQVDAQRQEVILEHGKLSYDYLVLALGSEPNFYGILGADKYGFPLKSLRDSFAIRNRLQFLVDTHRLDVTKKSLRIVIAGGGFAGVEIAGELKGFLDFLAWKENYPRHKMEVLVVEGSNQLMPGMDPKVSRDAYNRLKYLGTEIKLNALITKVEDQFLEFKDGERLQYDCLIWTAGVKARQVPFTANMDYDRGNRIVTNQYFQIEAHPSIFVVGDESCHLDSSGNPLPGTATQAMDHGKYVAYAITQFMQNRTPKAYQCKDFGYIVPVGAKWAILKTPRWHLTGYVPYLIRQWAWFRYFWEIIGLRRAIQLSWLENKLYVRND